MPAVGTLEETRVRFFETGGAQTVLEARSSAVTGILEAAFDEHLKPSFAEGLAVLAVGGFGRGELFPYSDIDICLLVDNEKQAIDNKASISAFLQDLWDAGLRMSHSIRTIAECCQLHHQNVELNISLLDQRFLAGDLALYSRLQPKLDKFFESERAHLIRHLCRLARARHKQYHDTIYHLEPNIKESAGGLRDLHLLGWLGKLDAPGLSEMQWYGGVEEARWFLYQLRCFLHWRSGRDNNLLTFDAQEEISEQKFSEHRSAEMWMREYFRHARAIFGAATRALDASEAKNSSLLAGFREWRSRLSNSEFTVARDRVFFKAPKLMESDPELALRLFEFVARHGIRLSLDAERRIAESQDRLAAYFSASRPLWQPVRRILSLPHTAMGLRAMHETGVLRMVFPEWATIECCVIRDFYHRYTVDEHTLVTIENLQALAASAEPGHRRFATLLAELEDPALLNFALMFHDVGKGEESEAHSIESARMADAAMERIQVPERQRAMIRFLVEQHLSLSAAMTQRDLEDPATARMLAEKVGTLEALKYLTLLTYADISAVNPTALSPWRLEQLWRVYIITHHELTRELQTERIEVASDPTGEREGFLKGLPVRYLRTHTPQEIELHLQLEKRRRDAEIALDLRKVEGGFLLTVLAKDRLQLFASVAGALSSFGMNILKAEAFANQQGTILDTFVFADPNRTLELNPTEMDRLLLTLERVLLGRVLVKDLLRYRPKPSPPSKRSGVAPRVAFDNQVSETATLIEIVAEDRPGLLYDVAAVLSSAGCNIELVLVDTEAHRAMDVFYVSVQNRKLTEPLMSVLSSRLSEACRG
ncbi:MAG: [protein-PII] uridylyltransferase [Bryobacteraceae bacterium]|nr:[protein-PII] uridylyltransferase [Bryobacteraceae bacterium]